MQKELSDITIKCKDCGQDFIFSVGEQTWYKEHDLDNQPARCEKCRKAKKNKFNR